MKRVLLSVVLALALVGTDVQAALRIDYSYVDLKSDAYRRFKAWVDAAVAGNPGYAFSASDAATMFMLTSQEKYCALAIDLVDAQVAAAEERIGNGQRPAVAGDSYLEAGPMISSLALTLEACGAKILDTQRTRWSAYAEQTLTNIWNPAGARWGKTAAPWSGWSIDNPGNNYYYSFVEATMYWALTSESEQWLRLLREDKLPALQAYFAKLKGGGSLEGTGYGTAHMRLFALYRVWRDSTGDDLANASSHVNDSILFWVHATLPTLDRFAPIGDQARVSIPEIYDYHRRLLLEARQLSRDEPTRSIASWWLHGISTRRMHHGFNERFNLLPAGRGGSPPDTLVYHAEGTGRLFARTSWEKTAAWFAFNAGPYLESHAHQDQGSFTLFSGDWLAVTENIWTHSGIQQGTETNNVLRFVRNGANIRQREGTISSMRITHLDPASGEVQATADLAPAYADDGVRSWKRSIDFANHRLLVHDVFKTTPDTTAIFQINVPKKPVLNGQEARAGKLRIKVLSPENASLSTLEWSTRDAAEFKSGWRIDIRGSDTEFLVEMAFDDG